MTTTARATIDTVLVIDYDGNGYAVLWSADGGATFFNSVRSRPLNGAERDRRVERLLAENPGAELITHTDFYGRLPERFADARVI